MQQQLLSDKDRKIALLKQELKVQWRESIVREQDRVLTAKVQLNSGPIAGPGYGTRVRDQAPGRRG